MDKKPSKKYKCKLENYIDFNNNYLVGLKI